MNSVALVPIIVEDEETLLTIRKLGTPSYLDVVEPTQIFHLIIDTNIQHWYDDIFKYLKDETILVNYDRNDRIILKMITIKYIIIGGVLMMFC